MIALTAAVVRERPELVGARAVHERMRSAGPGFGGYHHLLAPHQPRKQPKAYCGYTVTHALEEADWPALTPCLLCLAYQEHARRREAGTA